MLNVMNKSYFSLEKKPMLALPTTKFRFTCFPSIFTLSIHMESKLCIPKAEASNSLIAEQAKEMFYTCTGLDRASKTRSDPEWLKTAKQDEKALIIPISQGRFALNSESALFLSPSSIREVSDPFDLSSAILLGIQDSSPIFALDVSNISFPLPDEFQWAKVRGNSTILPPNEASLVAYASALIHWKNSHVIPSFSIPFLFPLLSPTPILPMPFSSPLFPLSPPLQKFCPSCASPLSSSPSGLPLICSSPSCLKSLYPRIDPAIITLVSQGDYVLLGRQSRWPLGRFSLLAGFAELAESLEGAVQREVQEETGVVLDPNSIRYSLSQPWPFPRSLMVGFSALALPHGGKGEDGGEIGGDILRTRAQLPPIEVDKVELEDARWFHRDFLGEVLSEGKGHLPAGTEFNVPGKYSAAHRMLSQWVGASWQREVLPEASIDCGTFKYILVQLKYKEGQSRLAVRGNKKYNFHADILEALRKEANLLGIMVTPLGGGRIEHHLEEKVISIYGYSQAFGQANHEVTAGILQKWYPLHDICTSNEGY